MPIEQARWNQSNIDSLFYAGCQTYVNQSYGWGGGQNSYNNYYFNLVQQPINMISGFQRQNRKSITYQTTEGGDRQTTDQYTKLMMQTCTKNGIYESFSRSTELSSISGMVLAQPYLAFDSEDPAQGDLKLKIWEYNAFMVDPFFREPDMSDANFVWCQEYITKDEAIERFNEKADILRNMQGGRDKNTGFYFLPENNLQYRNDLLVTSYVWYKSRKKRKKLYSRSRNQFFDYAGDSQHEQMILSSITDMEVVSVEVPSWKLAVVINDQLMFHGYNPLGFDECPFVPVYWNYDPHINYYDLRVRSLIRVMRDPQFLFNYKVVTNNDVVSATINAGYKRKVNAVANEDILKKPGYVGDILINDGFQMTDVEKIVPSALPATDIELANQMSELIYNTSGIQMENWAGQQDAQISSLTMMLKQAANLVVFQKYFDQWDHALKLIGDRCLKIVLNNWNEQKVAMLIGEEPSPFFYSKIFSKYKVIVEEGLLTPTQRNLKAKQMMDLNAAFGREVIPPSMIIKDMNIQGVDEIMQFLQQQEAAMAEKSQQQTVLEQTVMEGQLKLLYSQIASNLSMAREREGRTESNIGLFEERLSAITKNRALATKDKVDALEKLLALITGYGELTTLAGMNAVEEMDDNLTRDEDREKVDAKRTALANQFKVNIMGNQGNVLNQPQNAQFGV